MKYLNQLLRSPDSLGQLRLAVREISRLTNRIRAGLPDDLGRHVVGCAPRGDTVVVFAESASWASQLRYAQQQILQASREILGDRIRNVQFRIAPPQTAVDAPSTIPELSDSTRHLLRRTAEGINDDDLANALRRLGRCDDQDAD